MRTTPAPRSLQLQPSIVAASLATNLFALAMPIALLQVYDRVIPNEGTATLATLAAGLLVVAAADFAVRTARGQLVALAGARFEVAAHEAAMARLFSAGADSSWSGGDAPLVDRFAAIERVRRHHAGDSGIALLDLPFVVLFLGVMALISPVMAAGVIAITVLAALVVWVHRRRIDRLGARRADRDRRRHAFLVETLGGIEAIRSLGAEPLMERRYERLMGGSVEITHRLTASVAFTQGLVGTLALGSPILMSGLGSYLVIAGQMSVGGLAAAVLLTGRIVQPVLRIEALMAGERDVAASVRDLDALLGAPMLGEGRTPLARIDEIELVGVGWAGGPGEPPVLEGVDLAIRRGQCVSIEGEDGSGRSSLLALIAGHRRPDRGRVLVNGEPIERFDPADLGRRVSLLSPDHRMLDGTLFDNLTAFETGRHGRAAQDLAAELGIDEAVAAHHEGFGARVSARQAEGLPRAVHDGVLLVAGLVGRPDVILFDEANSNLDARIDRALLEALRRRLPDAITVMVTYRPSFRALADRRFALSGGRLTPLPQAAPAALAS